MNRTLKHALFESLAVSVEFQELAAHIKKGSGFPHTTAGASSFGRTRHDAFRMGAQHLERSRSASNRESRDLANGSARGVLGNTCNGQALEEKSSLSSRGDEPAHGYVRDSAAVIANTPLVTRQSREACRPAGGTLLDLPEAAPCA